MKCPNCNKDVSDGFKFCPYCATPIVANICPHCGSTNLPSDSKFCPDCGSPIRGTFEGNSSGSEPDADTLELAVGDVTFNMIKVEAGSFMMGSPNSDPEAESREKPQHKVTLTKDYYVGETVVTQALWREVMGCLPKALTDNSNLVGDNKPVVYVSWDD